MGVLYMELILSDKVAKLMPKLSDEEYEQLESNILKEGCRDSLITWNNHLIDGFNRHSICKKHNIEFKTIVKQFRTFSEVKQWIITNQLGRRNINLYQRSILALEMKKIFAEKAKEKQIEAGGALPQKSAKAPIDTREKLAKKAGVSHDTIAKVDVIKCHASEQQKEGLEKGDLAIDKVYQEIKKDEKIALRKKNIEQQKKDIEQNKIELYEGTFGVIVIDPPWNYGGKYDSENRRVTSPYPELTIDELKQLNIPASKDCSLWLWTTQKFIWDAKDLLKYWGFEYKSILVWDKQKLGMGSWLRMQVEFCLLGIKGKPLWNLTNERDIISSPRREHSRKPEEFYEIIDKLCVGKRLDYFSREKRKGFYQFGNEPNKYELAR